MAQDKKSSDEILKELFNSIHDIGTSEDDDGSGSDKKVVVKKEKKSKSRYDSSYCSKSKHKKKKKSKKSSTKYSLHIKSGREKKSKGKKSSSKSSSVSKSRKENSEIKVEKELDLIEVLKKEVIETVPSSIIPESIDLPPLPPIEKVSIKQEPSSPKKPVEKDDGDEKHLESTIRNYEVVVPKLAGTTPDDVSKEDCGVETISKVADVFEEDLLESGDKLLTKRFGVLDKPKKTIQIQNLKNSSILVDAAKSKAKSEELKLKKKKKREEGELTDGLSDISCTSDSEPDSPDDDAAQFKSLKLPEDVKRDGQRKDEKEKSRSKKKKKLDKHRHKEHKSKRRAEHKSRRSNDPLKSDRRIRKSRSRSRTSPSPSNLRSSSRHADINKHRDRRRGSRSRSRSLDRSRKRSQSPHSKRRRTSREPDDLRNQLKRRKSSERERSGERRNKSRGSPERSRSRQEKDEYYIDKGKLLEIARKNALSMLRQGQVSGDMNKVVQHITAAGKTVDELTDFCKHLSRKEATGMESVSSDSSSDESEKPFHHPFKLKERPSQIIMNIRNCVPLLPKTHQEKATEILRVQFPVSSGQHHRKTENQWIPVSPKRTETTPLPTTSKPKDTSAPLAIEGPPVVGPTVPKYPTVYPTPAEKRAIDISSVISERLAAIRKDYDASSSSVFGPSSSWEAQMPHTTGLFTGSTGAKVLTPMELASGQQAWARKNHHQVTSPQPSLLENGCSPQMLALKMAQCSLPAPGVSSREALNKRYGFTTELPDLIPGQLVCVTDLKMKGNIVKRLPEPRSYLIETTEGRQVDQLMSAAPVSGGMGMSLLQKMGWKPGEGLGKNHEGTLEPLRLPVKMDKKGLVCAEEMGGRQRQQQVRTGPTKPYTTVVKAMEGKHPVSLLNEFCTRRKYNPPEFHTVKETGPPHLKRFIMKVTVNRVDYQPSFTSSTKKIAKSEAAKVCLRSLGVLPNL